MKILTTYIVMTIIAMQPSDLKENLDFPNQVIATNEQSGNTPTTIRITKLKKPWYAWRGLVVRKMKETIPEYKNVEGLLQKYYSFVDDTKFLGGIYLWKSEEDATRWFNKEWFDKVEEKYGSKGIVDTYSILKY